MRQALVITIVIAIAAILCPPRASAGQIGVWGAGYSSCGEYLKLMKENPDYEISFGQWLLGYITGRNHASETIFDYAGGIDSTALLKWIENYCEDHPLDRFYNAATALLYELEMTGKTLKRPHK